MEEDVAVQEILPEYCDLCGKFKIKSEKGFKRHRGGEVCERNQGVQPINGSEKHVCDQCGKAFDTKHGLSIHRTTHGAIHRANLAAPFIEEQPTSSANISEGNVEAFRGRMLQWKATFLQLRNGREVDADELDGLVSGFSNELSKCIDLLPGPKNPNRRFYNLRKKIQREKAELQPNNKTGYGTTTNPERTSKRKQAQRASQVNYDQVQFDYYNQRRRVIRAVAGSEITKCPLKMESLMEAFEPRFSTLKLNTRVNYQPISETEQSVIDASFQCEVTISDIREAVKGIAVDSAAGPDRVLVRVVKQESVMEVLAVIATVLLEMNVREERPLPFVLRAARTVLLPKGGDVKDPNNYRPISICSVLRRVVERFLDRHLRRFVPVSQFQQGFTKSPGTHVNASIVGSVLRRAQTEKSDVIVVLLDIKRAFEEVPLPHLRKTLEASPLPNPLRNLILALQSDNVTQLEVTGKRSQLIPVRKGVFQGSPLSPMLYNVATDYVTRTMTEVPVATEYGFHLTEGQQPLTFLCFADDSTIIANSRAAAVQLTEMAIDLFQEIGLEVSPAKSKAIVIEKGVLAEVPLRLSSGVLIDCTRRGEKVRYLGATVSDQLDFDQDKVIRQLNDQVERLVNFPHLHADQKLNLLNQWLWPSLIYPLQTAPVNTIPKAFLQAVDKMVKSAVKEILQLSKDTPDAFLYSPRKYRGLGVMRATWEAHLQHVSICHALLKDGNPYVVQVRDVMKEIKNEIAALSIPEEKIPPTHNQYGLLLNPTKKLREVLRTAEFQRWTEMDRAKGVLQYMAHTPANQWVYNRAGLTNSEWITCLKMTVNGAPVRSLHGRSKDGPACRAPGCAAERETLSHVLGSCPKGDLLRNTRHHKYRTMVADDFRLKGWEVFEEVPCIGNEDSSRRIDIITIDRKKKVALILDPTVRYEAGENQAVEVDEEKRRIYEPCVPDLTERYRLQGFEVKVIGLYMGARGTVPKFFVDFCHKYLLSKDLIGRIVISILKGSCSILNHHLYSQQPVTAV